MSMLHEEKRINEIIDEEKRHIDRMNSLFQFIEEFVFFFQIEILLTNFLFNRCESRIKNGNVGIADVIKMFKNIKEEYYNEYKIYNLSDLSLPLLTPIINKYYLNWNPFKNEDSISLCYEIFQELKTLLEDSNTLSTTYTSRTQQNQQQQMDSFHRLLWEAWMPPIRQALLHQNIRSCHTIIDFIEFWTPILPQWIIENILEQLIMPKLTLEVENWNPLTDIVPIHAWIHPWLPLMKERLEPLYAPIRYKLSNALTNWHPSDNSAKAILSPWRTVFKSSSWDLFMVNNIIPKLEKCLEEFEINPRLQNIEPWKWVMTWEDLIPYNNFINLIDKTFFSKWLQVLSFWLNSGPNFEEVSRWYLGWKALFSEKLLNNPVIKAKLSQGLVMMNKSASGGAVSYTPVTTPVVVAKIIPPLMAAEFAQTTTTPAVTSFKDMMEKKAADHNLMFLPVPNRFYEGKQIYRLGNVNVYIDRNVIFYLNNGIWTPTGVNEVIKAAF